MVESAILSRPLLELILSEYPGRINAIVALLLKYGLLVAVQGGEEEEIGKLAAAPAQQELVYLVPSLLSDAPIISSPRLLPLAAYQSKCVLVFSIDDSFDELSTTKSSYSLSEIQRDALLPSGLFMRVLGRAVAWSQQTSGATVDSMLLSAGSASLVFGSQNLRLTECRAERFISLEIEGQNPSAVLVRIKELVQSVLSEFLPMLRCSTLLPISNNSSFVSFQLVKKRLEDKADLRLPGGSAVNQAQLQALFGLWNPKAVSELGLYDFFESYRWNSFDSDLTSKLFDVASLYSVGSSKRAPVVFLDTERLLGGLNFKEGFAKALSRSSVVVPIVSRAALERMIQHDTSVEDNLLLEWIMALECLASPDSRVQRILPIAFDEPSPLPPNAVSSFFASGLLGAISDAVPTKTVARAAALLRDNGVEPRGLMMTMTVKDVVDKLMENICVQLDQETVNPLLYAKAACAKIIAALNACNNLADLDPSAQESLSSSSSSAAVTTAGLASLSLSPLSPLSPTLTNSLPQLAVTCSLLL